MAVPEAEVREFLPQERGATHAFDAVNQKYFRTRTAAEFAQLPPIILNRITDDYVSAAIVYFANGTDDWYLENVGTIAWGAKAANLARFPCPTEEEMNDSLRLNLEGDLKGDAVIMSFDISEEADYCSLTIPPQLIVEARTKPIDALAKMAPRLSFVREFIALSLVVDPPDALVQRALATSAQFLLGAMREDPNLELEPHLQTVLTRYPQGMASLPEGITY